MIGAVVDTNTLASGFVRTNPAAAPAQIVDAWRRRLYALITSQHIITELTHTFARPYFSARLSPPEIAGAIALLQTESIVTPITVAVSGVATHPEDDLILATAISGRADYLVSGDRQLQKLETYRDVRIVSPRDFAVLLQQLSP